MARESRHLIVFGVPESSQEDQIKEGFDRYGPIEKVKLLPAGEEGEERSALVDFMDIKSAISAHDASVLISGESVRTEYSETTLASLSRSRKKWQDRRSDLDGAGRRGRGDFGGRPRTGMRDGAGFSGVGNSGGMSGSGMGSGTGSSGGGSTASGIGGSGGKVAELRVLVVRNISDRHTERSLCEGLFHEFKKHGEVKQVNIMEENDSRVAVVEFKKAQEAEMAMEAVQNRTFFGCEMKISLANCSVLPSMRNERGFRGRGRRYHAFGGFGGGGGGPGFEGSGGPGFEGSFGIGSPDSPGDESMSPEPADASTGVSSPAASRRTSGGRLQVTVKQDVTDAELEEEFDVNATRTLFVGNIDKAVTPNDLRSVFSRFGEILEVDMKSQRSGMYAFVQFNDMTSACRAKALMNGQLIGRSYCKVGFGHRVVTHTLWVGGINYYVTNDDIARKCSRFGAVLEVVVNPVQRAALVHFDCKDSAVAAADELRGKIFQGSRLKVDFANRNSRSAFYKQLEDQGGDFRPMRRDPMHMHEEMFFPPDFRPDFHPRFGPRGGGRGGLHGGPPLHGPPRGGGHRGGPGMGFRGTGPPGHGLYTKHYKQNMDDNDDDFAAQLLAYGAQREQERQRARVRQEGDGAVDGGGDGGEDTAEKSGGDAAAKHADNDTGAFTQSAESDMSDGDAGSAGGTSAAAAAAATAAAAAAGGSSSVPANSGSSSRDKSSSSKHSDKRPPDLQTGSVKKEQDSTSGGGSGSSSKRSSDGSSRKRSSDHKTVEAKKTKTEESLKREATSPQQQQQQQRDSTDAREFRSATSPARGRSSMQSHGEATNSQSQTNSSGSSKRTDRGESSRHHHQAQREKDSLKESSSKISSSSSSNRQRGESSRDPDRDRDRRRRRVPDDTERNERNHDVSHSHSLSSKQQSTSSRQQTRSRSRSPLLRGHRRSRRSPSLDDSRSPRGGGGGKSSHDDNWSNRRDQSPPHRSSWRQRHGTGGDNSSLRHQGHSQHSPQFSPSSRSTANEGQQQQQPLVTDPTVNAAAMATTTPMYAVNMAAAASGGYVVPQSQATFMYDASNPGMPVQAAPLDGQVVKATVTGPATFVTTDMYMQQQQANAQGQVVTLGLQPGAPQAMQPGSIMTAPTAVVTAPPPPAPQPVQQADALLGLLQRYPVMWQGHLALKNDAAAVQMHFLSGSQQLAQLALPQPSVNSAAATLRIAQRMRLDPSQLEGVDLRMQTESEHCLLLALPCGRDPLDVHAQTRALRTGFITYLQNKQAAGIINLTGNVPAQQIGNGFVLHIFPPCEFTEQHVARVAPDLLSSAADSGHLMVVIAAM